MNTKIAKLAAAVTFVGLACPGIANAEPLAGMEDIPGVDETFALHYVIDHDREVCRILDQRFAKADPDIDSINSVIEEVAKRGGFNNDTGAFVVGGSMASSCPEHIDQFEAAWGVEIA